jgi:Putative adhesin
MSGQLFISNGPVPPGHFSYLQDIPLTGGSVMISNVNGLVTLSTWNGNQALINGTIFPAGVGATPDQVNLQITNSNGLTISATYPAPTSERSYTLDLGVFLPVASNLTTLGVSLTSGRVQVSNLQVSRLSIYTASGSISATVHAVTPTGFYALTSDTGSINLNVPSTRAFQLTATTSFARVWASGLENCQVQSTAWNTFLNVGQIVTANCGGGGATFNAETHNGDITINRT